MDLIIIAEVQNLIRSFVYYVSAIAFAALISARRGGKELKLSLQDIDGNW